MDKKTARKFMGKIEDIASGLAKYVSNDSGEWNDIVANRALKSLQAACDHLEDIEESYRTRGQMLKENEEFAMQLLDGICNWVDGAARAGDKPKDLAEEAVDLFDEDIKEYRYDLAEYFGFEKFFGYDFYDPDLIAKIKGCVKDYVMEYARKQSIK